MGDSSFINRFPLKVTVHIFYSNWGLPRQWIFVLLRTVGFSNLGTIEIYWLKICRQHLGLRFLEMSSEVQNFDWVSTQSYTGRDTYVLPSYVQPDTAAVWKSQHTSNQRDPMRLGNFTHISAPWEPRSMIPTWKITHRLSGFCTDQNRRKLSLLVLCWWTSESISWINGPMLTREKLNRQP